MSEYLNEQIGYQLESTAEWRGRKAEEFPADTRNLAAAEELGRLAEEISALPTGSEIERQIIDAEASINGLPADASTTAYEEIIEAVSDELRAIGFHTSYTTQELLEWYRDLLREKLHDAIEAAVPAPDLSELVENDPNVKAAKDAYDEARAKAIAEARRKL